MPDKRRLNRTGEHDRGLVAMLLQRVQQRGGKPKASLHELRVVLGTIHACQIEHEVAVRTVRIQLFRRIVDIIAVDVFNVEIGPRAVLAVADVLEIVHDGRAHHALCAGH